METNTKSPITNKDFLTIHEALHDTKRKSRAKESENEEEIKIGEKTIPIQVSPKNGCRYLFYNKIMFMEQNNATGSSFAKQALNGDKITWGIRSHKPWLLAVNSKVLKNP